MYMNKKNYIIKDWYCIGYSKKEKTIYFEAVFAKIVFTENNLLQEYYQNSWGQ